MLLCFTKYRFVSIVFSRYQTFLEQKIIAWNDCLMEKVVTGRTIFWNKYVIERCFFL